MVACSYISRQWYKQGKRVSVVTKGPGPKLISLDGQSQGRACHRDHMCFFVLIMTKYCVNNSVKMTKWPSDQMTKWPDVLWNIVTIFTHHIVISCQPSNFFNSWGPWGGALAISRSLEKFLYRTLSLHHYLRNISSSFSSEIANHLHNQTTMHSNTHLCLE